MFSKLWKLSVIRVENNVEKGENAAWTSGHCTTDSFRSLKKRLGKKVQAGH